MSGHSKWSTIKRKKGANDAQRAKIFTKIAREIIVAVKAGGPDPDNNSSLKDAIAKARSNNMPNDNINRTIKKAAGDTDGDNYERESAGGSRKTAAADRKSICQKENARQLYRRRRLL